MSPDLEYITLAEAAVMLRAKSPKTVRRLVNRGSLKMYKPAGRSVVRTAAVKRLIENSLVTFGRPT
jgi:excisionase family DNA binding protein